MSRSTRIFLIVLGLALVLLALAALVYALQPAPLIRETLPLAPTLLAPPQVLP
jgi:hypothetical protein